MTIRDRSKRWFERLVAHTLAHPGRSRGRTLILAYHNVVRDAETGRGDLSLHLALSEFTRQLDQVQRHCVVTPLAKVLEEPGPGDALRVAITFDDAYAGAVELAFPELARRGLSATLFVTPGCLGAPAFWWDAAATGAGGLSPEQRRIALEEEAGRQGPIAARFGLAELPGLPSSYRCATAEALAAVVRLPGVTLGSHSWSHPNLARLEGEELAAELRRPLEWIAATGAASVPAIAWPYGLDSPAAAAAARKAGYAAGLRVSGGWLPRAGDAMRLPRFNIPAGLSTEGLLLRLAGIVDP